MADLIWKWTERGFFSEVYSLFIVKAYADISGHNFILINNSDAEVSENVQFNDFFEGTINHDTIEGSDNKSLKIFDEGLLKTIKSTIIESYRRKTPVIVPSLAFQLSMSERLKAKDALLRAIFKTYHNLFRLNVSTKEAIEKIKITHGLDSLNQTYHAIHIRRGDKLKFESEYIVADKYLERLDFKLAQVVYVATDDHEAIVEAQHWLKKHHGNSIRLMHMCEPGNSGYEQHEFSRLSKRDKLIEINILLSEYDILRRAHTLVGSFKSNILRTLYLDRNGIKTLGIDGPFQVNFDPYSEIRRPAILVNILHALHKTGIPPIL